jgi:hypothetical protein
VLSGSVVVAYVGPDGNVITQVVNAGEQFDLNTGLITPISTPNLNDMIRDALVFRIFVDQQTTYVAPDHRIFFISPVQNQNGQGQNQGGGGQGP